MSTSYKAMRTDFAPMPGCKITTKCFTNTYVQVNLKFEYTEVDTGISTQFTINGVLNFDFKIESGNKKRHLFVRFQRQRQNDVLDYSITFRRKNENTIFKDLDKWYFICSYVYNSIETISLKVDLEPLSTPCASLYEDTELTDFKLVGDDGYVLLHKAILAAYSPFFKNMFSGQWKETTEGVIEVSGISKQTLEHFKEYMYLGTFPDSCAKYLLLLSKFYMMEDLESRCLFKLRAEVTKANIFEVLDFASINKLTRLTLEVLDAVQHGDFLMDEL